MIKATCSMGTDRNRVTLQSSRQQIAFPLSFETSPRVFKGISSVEYLDNNKQAVDIANAYSNAFSSAPRFENGFQIYEFIRKIANTYSRGSMMLISSYAFYTLSGPFIGRELRYIRIPVVDTTPDRFSMEYGWLLIRKKGIEFRATNVVRGVDALEVLYMLIAGDKKATFKDPLLVD